MELSLRNFQKDGNLRLRTFESLGKESLEIIEKNVEPFSMEIQFHNHYNKYTKERQTIDLYFDHEYMLNTWNKVSAFLNIKSFGMEGRSLTQGQL